MLSAANTAVQASNQHLAHPSLYSSHCSLLFEEKELSRVRSARFKSSDEPQKPARENGKRIRINVSGKIFETYENTLLNREGSIFRLDNVRHYFDHEKDEFYFDRCSKAFEAIFTYLQCGIIYQPEDVPYRVFIEELQFFGFGEKAYEIFIDGLGNVKDDTDVKNMPMRTYVWNIFERPEFNRISRILSIFSTFIIFLSLIVFLIDTLPSINDGERSHFRNIELACVIWFTLEIVIRFVVSPNKCRFFFNWMNFIDVISVLPYYIDLIANANENSDYVAFTVLRVMRLLRVFRIFKLYRYSQAIYLIVHTMLSSIRELFLLLFFVLMLTILFSSGIYFFEQGQHSKFKSIPHSFWLCIVTITTVGYGDIVPVTLGRSTKSF